MREKTLEIEGVGKVFLTAIYKILFHGNMLKLPSKGKLTLQKVHNHVRSTCALEQETKIYLSMLCF